MLRETFLSSLGTSKKQGVFWILVFLFCLRPNLAFAQGTPNPQFSTISNGTIDVGVDVNGGGSIGYVAPSQTHGNVVNNHDFGRYIGQSYYSGPRPFGSPAPAYPNWPWNPVSAGDVFGHASQIISFSNDGNSIYVKSIPKQWALNNVPSECTFETSISLENNAVHVINRLVNSRSDMTQFSAFEQELPALYTTGRLFRLFAYVGAQPFTGDTITQIQNSPPSWAKFSTTEDWAALVDSTDFGLALFHPGQMRFAGGFAPNGGQPGTGGPLDPPCGYIGGLGREILDHNIVYTYDYYLILGTLTDIRNFVYSKHQQMLPNYVFASDRQHFYYSNTSDSGWPIQGQLHVNLGQTNAQLIAPISAWHAEQVPSLFINAAYHLSSANSPVQGQVALQYLGGAGFTTPVSFTVINDGQFHVYQVNLASSPFHHGIVTDLSFIPAANVQTSPGDSVDIMSISTQGGAGAPNPAPPPTAPPFGHHFGRSPLHNPFHHGPHHSTHHAPHQPMHNPNKGM
jgi:hypothetical protein